jgi:hypothetical protein
MGIFDSFKKTTSKDRGLSEMRARLCTSGISEEINRNDIVKQLIASAVGISHGADIAVIPYHPSATVSGLEAVRIAVSAEKWSIGLAICSRTKAIFFNHNSIKSLVDQSILGEHDYDWATFVEILYDAGMKVAIVDPATNRFLPFQK